MPPETATETATAIDCTLICASFVARMTTLPPTSIVPALLMNAVTAVSIELWASERPIEPAPPLPPERLAATAAACASAVMCEVSLAVTERSPVPADIAVPSEEASIRTPILLSVQRPPTLTA